MSPLELKIAYIGGGSRGWARKLMIDLALCSELAGEVALYDIDPDSARLNEQLGNWLQTQKGVVSHWHYTTVPTLPDALRGADFVVLSIQPGPLEIMEKEISIAESFGLYFPVGDTAGAPGLVRGIRTAIVYAQFAEAITTICPKAWVINYTNPMAICTRTLRRVSPDLKVFGCCHEVFATQRMLAALAARVLNTPSIPKRREIQTNVLGINHFTWIDQAHWKGQDLLKLLDEHLREPGVIRTYTRQEVESFNDWFFSTDQVKYALFQHFGILAAAGDRHLVEFLPGFIQSPEILFQWGIIRTPVSWRIERWRSAPQLTRDLIEGRTPLDLSASGEEGIAQIMALVGLGDLVTNINYENQGQVTNLPPKAVVETNAHISRDRVHPLTAGALPEGLAPLVAQHSTNQELIIEAALSQNKELAFQAVYLDPASHLTIDGAWKMYNQMLEASRSCLPGWEKLIASKS